MKTKRQKIQVQTSGVMNKRVKIELDNVHFNIIIIDDNKLEISKINDSFDLLKIQPVSGNTIIIE